MAFYLGLFGGAGPNPAAVLMENGEIIAFGEEERFSRIKNATNALPIASIIYCLKQAQIRLKTLKLSGSDGIAPATLKTNRNFWRSLLRDTQTAKIPTIRFTRVVSCPVSIQYE